MDLREFDSAHRQDAAAALTRAERSGGEAEMLIAASMQLPDRAPSLDQVYEAARYMDDWGGGFAAIGKAMADQQGRARPDPQALTRAAEMLLYYAAHGVDAKAEPHVTMAFQVAFDAARAAQESESRRFSSDLAAEVGARMASRRLAS